MASNEILGSTIERPFASAEEMTEGASSVGSADGLTQNTEATIRTALGSSRELSQRPSSPKQIPSNQFNKTNASEIKSPVKTSAKSSYGYCHWWFC
jgi:hypothetical protein